VEREVMYYLLLAFSSPRLKVSQFMLEGNKDIFRSDEMFSLFNILCIILYSLVCLLEEN
jgi:hypothetical protein